MIDPCNFTNFVLDELGLQEYVLFSLMVFNKDADQTSVKLEKFLQWCHKDDLFVKDHFTSIREKLRKHTAYELVEKFRFGNTTVKSRGLEQLVNSGLDLFTCTVDDLEKLSGFGMKTSRFFILHTRRDANVACLDTHILEWLRYYTNEDVPKSQPSKNKYFKLERLFLNICKSMNVPPSTLDLRIWNRQRGSEKRMNKNG